MVIIEFVDVSFFQLFSISIFGFIFGLFEASTNLFYLINKNYTLSRKQHGKELPRNATDTQVFHKVVQMFILGIILLFISLISSIIAPQLFTVGAAFILINGLIDYSKFRKRNMIITWTVIAFIAFIFSLIPLI
ncbi:MAG: DUF6442 family protein [Candidatus Hodarchaeota archaeon]